VRAPRAAAAAAHRRGAEQTPRRRSAAAARADFHKKAVNEALKKHGAAFLGDAPGRVLVPLCGARASHACAAAPWTPFPTPFPLTRRPRCHVGKTLDLVWLAKQKGVTQVVGVEYVPKAVEDFAKEHPELKLAQGPRVGPFAVTAAGAGAPPLSLYCGDFFKLPAAPPFARVWDRAALVALDPAQRPAYVAKCAAALAPRGRILLQTLERVAGPPAALAAGPPFSVTEADVAALYGRTFTIQKLQTDDAMGTNPRFKATGLTKVLMVTYLLTKK
jgi:thiopurine S-methyltransferase